MGGKLTVKHHALLELSCTPCNAVRPALGAVSAFVLCLHGCVVRFLQQ